jgi:hypothetical protein
MPTRIARVARSGNPQAFDVNPEQDRNLSFDGDFCHVIAGSEGMFTNNVMHIPPEEKGAGSGEQRHVTVFFLKQLRFRSTASIGDSTNEF